MSIARSTSKKRKRDVSPEAQFRLSESATGKVGPLLVSYPALDVPPSTHFKCYAKKKLKAEEKAGAEDEQEVFVVGETNSVEFVSNEEETRKAAESGCHYVVAVRNKCTGTISLLPSAKSPHILTRTVKALKSLPSLAAPSKLEYLDAKNTLGETFGTKKQKANIKAQQRNKIDVGAMEGVMDHLMNSIEKGAQGLLTAEESQEAADKNRLIPPFSADATDPAEVYPLHDIIPEAEWKALSISSFDAAQTDRERIALLPYRKSDWVNSHLKALANSTSKSKKKKMKILLYISAMLAFRQVAQQKSLEKEKVSERLGAVPGVTVESLITRFTETVRGSSSLQFTSATKTNLLTHIFALCLKVDDYASDTAVIAHDLSMPVSEVNQLFKSLGCKITKLGERERARLGLPDSSADDKRAVLTAPVQFPKPRMRRK